MNKRDLQYINPIWDNSVLASIDDALWDFKYLNLPELWAKYDIHGEGINTYVIDTGISNHHAFSADCKKYTFVNDNNPLDANGHGSWCCGKIAAKGVGIAPKCHITSLKGLSDGGSGMHDWINNALSFVLNEPNPHIINMSLGGYWRDSKQEKIINALHDRGVIIVAAAGNESTSDLSYPAAFDNVLAIAALDAQNERAYFSNYGDHIVVAAPGVSCYSVYKEQYRRLAGTSMASPIVAGLLTLGASLAIKKCPDMDKKLLKNILISALIETAIDLGTEGKDPFYGFGGLNGDKFMGHILEKL